MAGASKYLEPVTRIGLFLLAHGVDGFTVLGAAVSAAVSAAGTAPPRDG